jgi:flagellar biosynthesis/type III secretory pathway M-ring protein FliF/YscJ
VSDVQLAQIEAQIEPLVTMDEGKGMVSVHMVPDRDQLMIASGLATAQVPPGGLELVIGSKWAKPVGLGLLAMLSLGVMFGMVRKATQRPQIPSVEEMAGIPPKLPMEEEVVGEAEESEAAMAGLELDEQEIRIRKVAEQISDLVKSNPIEAGALFNKWVSENQ